MNRKILYVVTLFLGIAATPVFAGNTDCGSDLKAADFMRNDLAALKKKIQAATEALGQAPPPYALDSQNWSYPTGSCSDAKGYIPINVGFNGTFNTNGAEKKIADEYKQKVLAATAKGDYQATMELSKEMQAKVMALASGGESPGDVSVNVNANDGGSQTIDPDSVVRDGAGFIALENVSSESSDQEDVTFYFDPIGLKDADKIASFDLGGDYRVADPLDLINLRIEVSGPKAAVGQMVKQLNAAAVLEQLSAKRTKLTNG